MFRAARWRSEKNKIKAMFKLQFKATQVPGKGWEAVMVTLVPVDIGKPSLRSEKIAVVNGECRWLNPVYETVKLTQDQKTGKISDKVYQFIVSATGQARTGVLGEINVNLAEYAEVYKPTSVSLPLQDSNNGAILHVTIQRVQNDVQGREAVENGETPKEGNENKGNFAKSPRITLKSQLSNPENEEGGKADTGTNDINAAEEGSFINSKALVKFHSSRNMPSHGDSSGDLRKSSSFDGVSASGSESSSGQYTPKENGIKKYTVHQENASVLSPLSNSDTPQNTDWSVSIELDRSIAGSTNSSGETGLRERVIGSDNTLEKQKCDFDDLARQLEVSELELQTLRKQVMKESRRGQDLSRELSSVMEERDTLRKEYDKLKASNKRADDDENASAILQFGTKNPWSMLQEMKEELDHEKNLNANLRLQLQKTQESNSELIFAVRDLEELLDQKKSEICYNQDSQGTECQKQLSHLRNSEDKQELLETTSDNEEEQCELDILVKEHDNIKVVYSQEQRILDLTSELELYKKDREDLEMQLEQLALDYEILKQENHDISSRLEQIQLREQLRMQYECSAHLSIINDLESHVENLEKELEKQSEEYEANLANLVRAKVEEEQRAIQAEEELRKTRWKNANTVEQLQEEFKRLSSQLMTTFCANEDLVMKTLDESRALRMEKCHMEALLEEKNEELSSLQLQHRVNCQQLLSLVDFKTKEVDRLVLELKDKREELDKQKQYEEATQKATREGMSILKAEMEQLSREKHYLSEQIDQKEKQVAEVTKLRTSTKEVELQLQERNLERDVLEKELSLLREEAANLLEELNALRHLKDEQEVTVKALNLKVQTLMTQNTDLKIGFSDDELEKENLRELIFLLRGDLSKEVDVIATIEKRFKGKNVRGMVAEGTPMIYKSRGSFQAAHRSLHENSEPFDEDIDTKSFGDENRNILDINASQFLEKIIQDEDFVDHSHDTTDERLRRNLDANTKAEVETLASCPYDQNKLAEVLSQMEELKEQNESMEAELKEMQQRYSEMSLKFAEVEGERQQLVIRIRTLKNAMKN